MNAVPDQNSPRSPWFWAGMMLASFGVIAALRLTDAIDPVTGYILIVGGMVLIVPMVRASMARQKHAGHLSSAIVRYTRRFMFGMFGYMIGLGLAITLHERADLPEAGTFMIALLPVIPIFVIIWAIARYLVEEEDEYLRHRATIASLAGLGLVLGLGGFWGFLETFGVAPHVDAWWTFPVWALGMGAAQCWMAIRDRRDENSAGGES